MPSAHCSGRSGGRGRGAVVVRFETEFTPATLPSLAPGWARDREGCRAVQRCPLRQWLPTRARAYALGGLVLVGGLALLGQIRQIVAPGIGLGARARCRRCRDRRPADGRASATGAPWPRPASGSSASPGLAARAHGRACCGDVPETCHAPTVRSPPGRPAAPRTKAPQVAAPRRRSYQPRRSRAGDRRAPARCALRWRRRARQPSERPSFADRGLVRDPAARLGAQALPEPAWLLIGAVTDRSAVVKAAFVDRPAPLPPLLVSPRRDLSGGVRVEGRAVPARVGNILAADRRRVPPRRARAGDRVLRRPA